MGLFYLSPIALVVITQIIRVAFNMAFIIMWTTLIKELKALHDKVSHIFLDEEEDKIETFLTRKMKNFSDSDYAFNFKK